ncbi:hypothetical protein EVAR_83832_1 [Eumeta japonica]|uniref:Uncharacterized protein n=1 Tax=Eumeta variegata TaxID=151549 RepID=A0A4C1WH79_EUMVA|nr:hypothetical protein EVAR_83832_1 [Eumeta japonica]
MSAPTGIPISLGRYRHHADDVPCINMSFTTPKPPVYRSRNSVTLTIALSWWHVPHRCDHWAYEASIIKHRYYHARPAALPTAGVVACDVWLALEARDGLRADDVPAPPAQFDGTFTAQRLW